ncbi:MAG TPA: mannose-1-phosphate guanylyltransferase [Acidobacteriota bacterium]|nr:mannose-1-phosphate guanylyltransferase [Acidobacteriota bacterium]HQM64045.1 mannose-1-phosphate guanylyltransferase [Acidobacteriota bacterium]
MARHAVIMAGGSGTRFWPWSRRQLPKQFLKLGGDRSLFELTLERIRPLVPPERTLVICNRDHVDLVGRLAPELPAENIIGEPVARNTAPCIALAALIVQRRDPEGTLCVLPADHHVKEPARFQQLLDSVLKGAEANDRLVTFGIIPTHPHTGYGYVQASEIVGHADGVALLGVDQFVEKPHRSLAEEYVTQGNYYWNSGMFVWKARVVLEELRQYAPDVLRPLTELAETGDHLRTGDAELERVFQDLPSISIDYSIMEKSRRIVLARGDFGWSDLGSWDSLEDVLAMDNSNVTIGAPMILVDTRRCVVCAHDRLVACVGVEDLVVVATGDAVLVAHKDKAQDVRQVVQKLEADGRDEYL